MSESTQHGYRPGYILIKEISDDIPQLYEIRIIVHEANEIYFIVEKFRDVEYCHHYHACYVTRKEKDSMFIFKISDFCDYHAYTFHQSFNPALSNYYFIVQKYYII